MTYKVMARRKGSKKCVCRAVFHDWNANAKRCAEDFAAWSKNGGLYDRIRIVEIPGPKDNKPYTKKETIILA